MFGLCSWSQYYTVSQVRRPKSCFALLRKLLRRRRRRRCCASDELNCRTPPEIFLLYLISLQSCCCLSDDADVMLWFLMIHFHDDWFDAYWCRWWLIWCLLMPMMMILFLCLLMPLMMIDFDVYWCRWYDWFISVSVAYSCIKNMHIMGILKSSSSWMMNGKLNFGISLTSNRDLAVP